jgi:hypothetical protein
MTVTIMEEARCSVVGGMPVASAKTGPKARVAKVGHWWARGVPQNFGRPWVILGIACACGRMEMGGERASRWTAAAAQVLPVESKVVREPPLQVTQIRVGVQQADCT